MTFYNLPGVDAKVEFDAKAKVLVISGLSATDRVITHATNGWTTDVEVQFRD